MEDGKIKNILITGASSGIGRALALHYAAQGQRLFLGARNAERLEHVANFCRDKGAEVHTQIVDVSAANITHQWIMGVDKRYPLDLVIANAGISGGTAGLKVEEFGRQSDRIFEINLMGVLNTVHPALARMASRSKGQVAIISSLAGFAAYPGAPAYSASKAAVRFYGEALRSKFAQQNIQISVVCPGFVRSSITDANDFPMPFLMEAEKAAFIIAKGLEKNKGLIIFPWIMGWTARTIGLLPRIIRTRLLVRVPEKTSLQKI